jgi:predicted DsbA family dithiol-disulfide isomerase
MLNANLPKGTGVDKLSYYNQRFGQERVNQIISHMKQVGNSVGIKFSYGGSIGNTFDSHRLIWKAHEEGGSALQDKVVESLFKAYFEEEKSLGEKSVLRDCASRAGMDASSLLEDELMGKEETMAELNEFRSKYRVTGVPFMVIDGKFTLSGAQPPEDILFALEELL